MTISDEFSENERPSEVWCDPDFLHVRLKDGREIAAPLWWYPKLLNATPSQRNDVELMIDGIHWPQVDEDLSVDGILNGRKAPGAKQPQEAA